MAFVGLAFLIIARLFRQLMLMTGTAFCTYSGSCKQVMFDRSAT